MIIENDKGQVIDFWSEKELPANPKRIGFSLSGGTDSALLLYFTCKLFENTDTEIIPITSNRVGYIEDTPGANKIIQLMRELFPNVEIRDTEDHTFARVYPQPFNKMNEKEFMDRNKCDLFMNGRTLAPPKGMKEFEGFKDYVMDVRDGSDKSYSCPIEIKDGFLFYHPFAIIDKKWIADIYNKYNLMHNLFPLTVSCISLTEIHGTEPCRGCFWCKEKYWAFGCYDGGVK